eukprot:ANDGO_01931.mRNA.1 hypothetical protein ACA1_138350
MKYALLLWLIVGIHLCTATVEFHTPDLDELYAFFPLAKCRRNVYGHCEKGTLVPEPWLNYALGTQRLLQLDLPLDKVTFLGTHNSFNDRGDNYGLDDNLLRVFLKEAGIGDDGINIAQQEYTMTDSLNFGIRLIMLDAQWCFEKVRLSHAGTSFAFIDKIITWVEDHVHKKFNVSSQQLGCAPWDRPWEDGIAELATWLFDPENANEVMALVINSDYEWDWGHAAMVMDPIVDLFRDAILKPSDVANVSSVKGQFPTVRDMIKANKRIILWGDGTYSTYGGEYVFLQQYTPFPHNDAKYFNASLCAQYAATMSCISGESMAIEPIYYGPTDMGLITPELLRSATNCNVKNPKMDQASEGLLESAVWTWQKGEPSLDPSLDTVAIVLDAESSRWHTVLRSAIPFSSSPVPCRSIVDGKTWQIGTVAVGCPSPETYAVDVPRDAYEQAQLLTVFGQSSYHAAGLLVLNVKELPPFRS